MAGAEWARREGAPTRPQGTRGAVGGSARAAERHRGRGGAHLAVGKHEDEVVVRGEPVLRPNAGVADKGEELRHRHVVRVVVLRADKCVPAVGVVMAEAA